MSDKNNSPESESVSNQSTSTPNASNENVSSEENNYSALAKRFLWAESASSVERVIFWLGILCAFLFVMDFVVHRHAYAPGEGLPGFYAVVGFVAFTLIVLGATQLRRLILRDESYYSPNSVDAEHYPEEGLERLNHEPQATATASIDATDATSVDDTAPARDDNDQSVQKNSDRGDLA